SLYFAALSVTPLFYTHSLHDALPISTLLCWDLIQRGTKEHSLLPFITRKEVRNMKPSSFQTTIENQFDYICKRAMEDIIKLIFRSEEHTSELQSRFDLVCSLLLA